MGEHIIIRCLKCGQKNRVDSSRIDRQPICGACRHPLDNLIVQCFFCGTKNRISDERLEDRPICGRCRLPLYRTSPIAVNEETFEEEVLRFPGAVLLGYLSEEDHNYSFILSYFASKYAGGIKTTKIPTAAASCLRDRYSLDKSPALLIFYNGLLIETIYGEIDKEDVERKLLSVQKDRSL